MAESRGEPNCEEIRKALKEYDAAEGPIDRPLLERLGARIRQQGYLGADDLYLIVVWKSVPRGALTNARGALNSNTPAEIQETTRKALELVAMDDGEKAACEAIKILIGLDFVKVPIASAILTFYDPTRFGAIDPNAWRALGWQDDDGDWAPGDYGRYVVEIREIAKRCGLTPRQVDAALYQIGAG